MTDEEEYAAELAEALNLEREECALIAAKNRSWGVADLIRDRKTS